MWKFASRKKRKGTAQLHSLLTFEYTHSKHLYNVRQR
jgi:hypothetical protein